MIGLGFRLLFRSGRQAVIAMAVTITTIAVGTTLLLFVAAVPGALQTKADRLAWDDWSVGSSVAPESTVPHTALYSSESFCSCGHIKLIWLDGTEPGAPVFPGLAANPAPGEVFVSPALRSLMESSSELRQRYGTVTGTLDDSVLTGPDSLAVARHLPAALMDPFGTRYMTRFSTRSDDLDAIYAPGTLGLLVTAAGTALLLPLILLLANVARLTAASRERRLSALRLSGATGRQIGVLTAVESLVSAGAGVGLSVPLFFALRPWAAYVSDDERWFTSDLTPDLWIWFAVFLGVPALTLVSAHLTLRRARISPLGAARRAGPVKLTLWRVLPLVVLALAVGAAAFPGVASALGGARLVPIFLLLLVLALLAVGPWFIRGLGWFLSVLPGAARLLAGRRLMDDPRGAFRSIVGIVLAICTATIFTAVTPAAVADALPPQTHSGLRPGSAQASLSWVSKERTADLVTALSNVSGISAVTTIFRGTAGGPSTTGNQNVWIAECSALTVYAYLGECGTEDVLVADASRGNLQEGGTALHIAGLAPGALDPAQLAIERRVRHFSMGRLTAPNAYDVPGWIVAPRLLTDKSEQSLRPNLLLFRFESPQALEKARTVADGIAPGAAFESSKEAEVGNTYSAIRIRNALIIGSMIAFLIAGISLAVVVTLGLLERQREYTLLRLTGVPVGVLRTAMFTEAAFPLVICSSIASFLGLALAMTMSSPAGATSAIAWALVWPPLVGIGASLLVIALALPPVRKLTESTETRFE